jgi:hypothetical protein
VAVGGALLLAATYLFSSVGRALTPPPDG